MSAARLRILGIDPGTIQAGWGVIDVRGPRLTCIGCGTLKAPRGAPVAERLLLLTRELRRVVQETQPTEAAIEEAFYGRDVRSALRIGEARGALVTVMGEAGLQVSGYANNVIKKAVTGVGRAGKRQVHAMVMRMLNLNEAPASTDASDALAIAICHSHRRTADDETHETVRGAQDASGVPPRVREAIESARREERQPPKRA